MLIFIELCHMLICVSITPPVSSAFSTEKNKEFNINISMLFQVDMYNKASRHSIILALVGGDIGPSS